jgi:hypothetical protein
LKGLKKNGGAEEVHDFRGAYQIIASIEADTINELVFIITKQIENNEKSPFNSP